MAARYCGVITCVLNKTNNMSCVVNERLQCMDKCKIVTILLTYHASWLKRCGPTRSAATFRSLMLRLHEYNWPLAVIAYPCRPLAVLTRSMIICYAHTNYTPPAKRRPHRNDIAVLPSNQSCCTLQWPRFLSDGRRRRGVVVK